MAKKLCKSHVTILRKVATQLAYKQKMDGRQLILGLTNKEKIEQAEQLIYKAMNLLETIE
jgi:uncharacterized protein YbcC (UPF0753/DUF2309 family)